MQKTQQSLITLSLASLLLLCPGWQARGHAHTSETAPEDPFASETSPFYQSWLELHQALPELLQFIPALAGGPHSQILFASWRSNSPQRPPQ
ncbi:MAG: hypothetical protein AB7I41_12695 [Candidatus Sericytochromatia bacterium]